MPSTDCITVVLGTGGTIAGTASQATEAVAYRAGQIGADVLVAAVPALAGLPLEVEQVAQIDSKDIGPPVWRALVEHVAHHLARPEVGGLVITHGTDTLEETAYLLQRVLAPRKPVVLTAAMRPATHLQADGPQNLLDAVQVARLKGAAGVVAAVAGCVWSGLEVRKVHSTRLAAFDAGDAGPIALLQAGRLTVLRPWPAGTALGASLLQSPAWPTVEIVSSHGGAGSLVVDALLAAGVDGLVVAATGNGTVHATLEAALQRAQDGGVAVRRCSRAARGGVVPAADGDELFHSLGALTPAQARLALCLELMASS